MNSKILSLSLFSLFATFSAHATPFNGYIVKVKEGSNFLASNTLHNYGQVTKTAETTFGTFARLETNEAVSGLAMQILANNFFIYLIFLSSQIIKGTEF